MDRRSKRRDYAGIDKLNPRAGYRNVATTRLDELLEFNDLVTRSEMAIHNNELGTVSELAAGYSPKAGLMLGNERVADDFVQTMADPNRGYGKKLVGRIQ